MLCADREKYIYALMSAVSIFCLGAGASLLHGVQALFEPPHLQDMSLSLFGEHFNLHAWSLDFWDEMGMG
mgnify:CR=1 FL=1